MNQYSAAVRAAEAGHSDAQYALAKLLQEQDRISEAIPWYEEAAEGSGLWPMAIFFSWIWRSCLRSMCIPGGAGGGVSRMIWAIAQRRWCEAYSIHNNNFVKLRDIGKTVDFSVTYDAATNSVHIDSTQPYREEVGKSSTIGAVARRKIEEQTKHIAQRADRRHPGAAPGNLSHRGRVPYALPFHQRWALLPRHPLLRLGYAV